MAFNPLSLISGGIKGLVDSVGGILDKLSTTDEEKMRARNELATLTLAFQAKMAETFAAAMEVQSKVIIAEAQGESWLQRNWRPIFALTLVAVVFFNFLVVPIFHLPEIPTPERMWDLMELCLGGYIGGRTLEKVIVPAVEAYAAAKKP